MQLKKKVAVIATSAVAAVAVATGAWAYVAASGSGNGTATANAATATLTLHASASITDLDTAAAISVIGSSDKPNRHISTLTVTVDTTNPFPAGCDPTWFSVSTSTFAGHTFTTTGNEPFDSGATITMNNADTDQTACLGKSIPLTVTAS